MNALEYRTGARRRGIEPAAQRSIFLLEISNALAHVRWLRVVRRVVEITQALLGGDSALPVARELFSQVANQALQLPKGLDVRSCVAGQSGSSPDDAARWFHAPRFPSR